MTEGRFPSAQDRSEFQAQTRMGDFPKGLRTRGGWETAPPGNGAATGRSPTTDYTDRTEEKFRSVQSV